VSEAKVRRQEAVALGAAAGAVGLIVLLLSVTGQSEVKADVSLSLTSAGMGLSSGPVVDIRRRVSSAVSPVLKTAAQLCTDFACVQDVHGLEQLLARASDIMDAAGIVVWMGNASGAELTPVLSHGYSADTRARLPNVPRDANNAAAAAYRSGDMQIVASRPGGSKGAIVAPILGAQGCIGALSAEIRAGGEASEGVQALAAILAAQLAGILTATPAPSVETRAAAASS
jgi:hypothetical protein